jgi:hypothetical protein
MALSTCLTCYVLFFHFLPGPRDDDGIDRRQPQLCFRNMTPRIVYAVAVNGHCATMWTVVQWTYRSDRGSATYWEYNAREERECSQRMAMRWWDCLACSQTSASVLDFGGGRRVFLAGFRNTGVTNAGHGGTSTSSGDRVLCWYTTGYSPIGLILHFRAYPNTNSILVVTMEVAEHTPVRFHRRILLSLRPRLRGNGSDPQRHIQDKRGKDM